MSTPLPPPSSSSMLKLLLAAGPGVRVELAPEHIGALREAVAALEFQRQVRLLALAGPAPAPSFSDREPTAGHRPQQPRAPRPERAERPDRGSRPARATAEPADRAADARPAQGAGAVWTSQEESDLKRAWESDEDLSAIALRHGRSPSACFSRLARIGAAPEGAQADAARFLIHRREPIAASSSSEWTARAAAMGFDPASAPARSERR